MKLPITIEYNSGEQATYVAQPPEWAKWEKQTGNTIGQAKEKLGMWDLMRSLDLDVARLIPGHDVRDLGVGHAQQGIGHSFTVLDQGV